MNGSPTDALTTGDLARLRDALSSMAPASDDSERIDRLRLLEELKSTISAAQAVEGAEFDRSQRAEQARNDVPAKQQGRGVASQLALALRVSPWRAQRWLGFAHVLTTELPATFAELRAGRTTEWRATIIARETLFLSREQRMQLDAALAPRLEGWGDRRVEAEARRAAYRLDPAGSVARTRNAETERRVSIRPAPDTMCRVTALVPVAEGVAAYGALCRAADTTTAAGDARGRGQIMADTFVERLTGQAHAAAVPVEVNVVLGVDTLLGTDDEPAHVDGYGPVPAGVGRRLALGTLADGGSKDGRPERWVRRLFTAPGTGRLVAMETHRRRFTRAQQKYLVRRDQVCRTPWCGAPIRHADHVIAHLRGGRTAVANSQGLCEACNYARQAPGWTARVSRNGTVTSRSPTGHAYLSHAPDPPGVRRTRSPVEEQVRRALSVVRPA